MAATPDAAGSCTWSVQHILPSCQVAKLPASSFSAIISLSFQERIKHSEREWRPVNFSNSLDERRKEYNGPSVPSAAGCQALPLLRLAKAQHKARLTSGCVLQGSSSRQKFKHLKVSHSTHCLALCGAFEGPAVDAEPNTSPNVSQQVVASCSAGTNMPDSEPKATLCLLLNCLLVQYNGQGR